tara:strand:- start:1154 stop:2755 length:1602 start_codon:yes stop_codon:yes gene_type:complete
LAYIFPKRALQGKDVLDPVELNEDFIPAAETASGRLNAHNIDSNTKATIYTDGVSKTAYYDYYYTSQESDIGLGNPSSWSVPERTSTSEHVLTNDMEWDSIAQTSLTVVTGTSKLWVIGHLQYAWLGFGNGTHQYSHGGDVTVRTATPGTSSQSDQKGTKVQFAIRLNGNVLTNTITGELDPFLHKVWATTASRGREIGSLTPNWSKQPTGIGPEVFPVRLGTSVEVTAGTHTLEIVGRRIPLVDEEGYARDSRWYPGTVERNEIVVYNRQLFALNLPIYPPTATTKAAVDVKAYDTEQLITPTSIGASRVYAVRDALNNIEDGNLARGALAHYHLTSPVINADQVEITGPKVTTTNKYPGFSATTTITTSSTGTGWRVIQDASGNQLLSNNGGSEFSLADPCVFVVTANVQMLRVRQSGSKYDYSPDAFCGFAIGVKTSSGGEYVIKASQSHVNHYAASLVYINSSGSGQTVDENCDVALFALIKSSDLSGDTLNHVAVYSCSAGAQAWTATPSAAEVCTHRGNLSVIQLKV